jgi:Mn2+/Fe2+ NRAMP family transporter
MKKLTTEKIIIYRILITIIFSIFLIISLTRKPYQLTGISDVISGFFVMFLFAGLIYYYQEIYNKILQFIKRK